MATQGPPLGMKRGNGAKRLPCALAIFLIAFLLFHMQMLLGKQMLPFLGGAPAVWTACLLLFQLLLLAGYGYSHGSAARLARARSRFALWR